MLCISGGGIYQSTFDFAVKKKKEKKEEKKEIYWPHACVLTVPLLRVHDWVGEKSIICHSSALASEAERSADVSNC